MGIRTSTYRFSGGHNAVCSRAHIWEVALVLLAKQEDLNHIAWMLTGAYWLWSASCVDVHLLRAPCPILHLKEVGMGGGSHSKVLLDPVALRQEDLYVWPMVVGIVAHGQESMWPKPKWRKKKKEEGRSETGSRICRHKRTTVPWNALQ